MKKIDVIGGLDRLIEAATEKFNSLCEEGGYDPEDPILNGEEDNEEGEGEEEGEGGEMANAENGNVMPEPSIGADANMPMETPDATGGQMPSEGGMEAAVDVGMTPEAPVSAEGQPMPTEQTEEIPNEEEQMKAAQLQQ